MKKLIMAALISTLSLSSFAQGYLIEAECTGTYDNGVELSVNIHLPEAYYCDGGEPGNTFQGVVVSTSPVSGQEVFTGTITETTGEENYAVTVGFTQNFPGEGTA